MKVLAFVLLALVAVSGSTADGPSAKGQFPAVVSLLRAGDFSVRPYFNVGTGVIISPTTILTAASLLTGTGRKQVIAIQAGLNAVADGKALPLPPFIQELQVAKITLHPDYDLDRGKKGLTSLNDIALIKLSGKLNYTDIIKPLSLPTANAAVADNSAVQAAGWGKYLDSNGFEYTYGIQQFANLNAVNYQTCYNAVDDFVQAVDVINVDEKLTQCVGPIQDGTSLPPTYGDAGGPIIQNNNVVGISSYRLGFWNSAENKKKRGPVGIYTKVSSYVSWIKANTNDL